MPKKIVHDAAMKINVTNFHLAKAEQVGDTLVFETPERILGVEEVTRTPALSGGKAYGDGKLRKNINKKTAYNISFNHNGLPSKWRAYIEGTTISTNGVESANSKDEAGIFACGWEVEKTEGQREMIWFLCCTAEPLGYSATQSGENIVFSNDSVNATALEHNSIGRFFTFIDSETEDIPEEFFDVFFDRVQTTDTISGNSEEPKE